MPLDQIKFPAKLYYSNCEISFTKTLQSQDTISLRTFFLQLKLLEKAQKFKQRLPRYKGIISFCGLQVHYYEPFPHQYLHNSGKLAKNTLIKFQKL